MDQFDTCLIKFDERQLFMFVCDHRQAPDEVEYFGDFNAAVVVILTSRLQKQQQSDVLLFERLACLGITGALLRPTWNPSDHCSSILFEGFKAAFNWAPLWRKMPVSLTINFSQTIGCNVLQSGILRIYKYNTTSIYLNQADLCLIAM